MKNIAFLFLTVSFTLLLSACQSDEAKQEAFAGRYSVTIESPEAEKELKKAKKEINQEIEDAQDEIRSEMKKAREEIEAEFGEDSEFGEAIGSFVEGIGDFAADMTELGESLGSLGIDLGSNILGNIEFEAEFQNDGDVVFGGRKGIRISTGETKWEIKNGKFYLWDEDEGRENATEFKMVRVKNGGWDLIDEDVILHLEEVED